MSLTNDVYSVKTWQSVSELDNIKYTTITLKSIDANISSMYASILLVWRVHYLAQRVVLDGQPSGPVTVLSGLSQG